MNVPKHLPKNNAMIKFLAEEGAKLLLQKTENHYMQDQSKEMYIIDDDLYFTIEEKNNSIELTDKGIDLISKNVSEDNFYILPDVGTEMAKLEEKAKAGEEIYLRPISGMNAMEEAVGRATEMGTSVLFVPGISGLDQNKKILVSSISTHHLGKDDTH